MRTSQGALETSLYWQEHVARAATSKAQRDRCQARALKLRTQLASLQDTTEADYCAEGMGEW